MKKLIATLATAALSLSVFAPAAGAATKPPANIWASCASSQALPAYGALVKGLYGTCVHSDAQVYQFNTITGNKAMLVDVAGDGGNGVWLDLSKASLGSSIYNNDLVYLVGRLDGTYTYDTNGGTNTVPLIDVTQLRLAGTTTTTVKPTVTTHGHVVRAFQNITGGTLAGGYILYSNGQVNAVDGAPFYGDARHSGATNFVAIAQDTGSGYWLVTATGHVYTYGNLCQGDTVQAPSVVGPIVGTLSLSQAQQNSDSIDTGFLMVNAQGTVYSYLCVNNL